MAASSYAKSCKSYDGNRAFNKAVFAPLLKWVVKQTEYKQILTNLSTQNYLQEYLKFMQK